MTNTKLTGVIGCEVCGRVFDFSKPHVIGPVETLWGYRRTKQIELLGSTATLSMYPEVCSETCRSFVDADPSWPRWPLMNTGHRTRWWKDTEGNERSYTFTLERDDNVPDNMPSLPDKAS